MKIKNLLATALLALAAADANAAQIYYDFTTALATQNIGGAIFTNVTNQPTGSGVIDSFVRISDASPNTGLIVEGYNTSTRPLGFDENSSPTFTHDVLLSDLGVVTESGINYYGFVLDINQTGNDPFLSFDELQIYTSALGDNGTAVNTQAGLGTLGVLRYDLDASNPPDGNGLQLNYNLNSGSGSGDLLALIPVSAFAGALATDKVSLYSLFGATGSDQNNDGYEEWFHFVGSAVCIPSPSDDCIPDIPPDVVPEPGILALLATGLLGIGVKARSKKG